MMKRLILAVAAAMAISAPAAAQTYRFAIVPKAMNNPYFDLSRDGCIRPFTKPFSDITVIKSANPRS